MSEIFNVTRMASTQLERAREGSAGRSAAHLYGGPQSMMTHTLVALVAGQKMHEHESPGEATVLVVEGRVTMGTADGATAVEGQTGDLLRVPLERHWLQATTDSVILLTAAKTRGQSAG
ncbi:MAG TPA: LuxR family transcriptional regulator [Segeticoccus sp.]|nr:LuxR family transcriptional regulator [Segeticoccus sp.]